LAELIPRRSQHLTDLLERAKPRHEPEVEEAGRSLKESRPAMPSPMLDIMFRSGKVRSFSYAYLSEIEFEPGDTLTLKFTSGADVVIEGRGLERHRSQVRLHRADYIQENTESELALAADGVSQVEAIYITEAD
jgi:hypothetical protein